MRLSRKRLDLTGQRYGNLVAQFPAENIGGRTAWVCRCDCGQQTVVKTYYLRHGRVTACKRCRAGGAAGLTYVDGTCVEMLRAKTVRKNNTSGVPGVDWWTAKNRWRATICFKGKRYYLGSYQNFEDAVRARKQAEARMHDQFLAEFDHAAGSD